LGGASGAFNGLLWRWGRVTERTLIKDRKYQISGILRGREKSRGRRLCFLPSGTMGGNEAWRGGGKFGIQGNMVDQRRGEIPSKRRGTARTHTSNYAACPHCQRGTHGNLARKRRKCHPGSVHKSFRSKRAGLSSGKRVPRETPGRERLGGDACINSNRVALRGDW